MKYKVTVVRHISVYREVEVEAPTEDAAWDRGDDLLCADDGTEIDFTFDGLVDGDVQDEVVSVEEV